MALQDPIVSTTSASVFKTMQLKCAIVEEGLSMLTCARVELLSKDRAVALQSLVGEQLELTVSGRAGEPRLFKGTCVSAEYLGRFRDWGRYLVEVRPKLWFFTLGQQSRVFQGKSVPEIVQDIFADYGFSEFFKKKLSATYPARDICVQYRETDLDFIKRLLEEEGIYFFFQHSGKAETFVMADGATAHESMSGNPVVEYHEPQDSFNPSKEHFAEVVAKESATSGKVMLTDYNFEKPATKLKAAREMPKGKHGQNGIEIYDYPGHFRTEPLGVDRVKVRMEAEAVKHVTWTAVGNIVRLCSGQIFQLKNHPQTHGENKFLCTRATYYIQSASDLQMQEEPRSVISGGLEFAPDNKDLFRAVYEIIPDTVQYRAPLLTPWPEVQGIQTAVVVGPAGEEIHTDKYGRVKIKFHWDRREPKNDTVSVWVRTMMPWTGKGWGMIHVPRIGQEVVVQFEEGDPDRPIVIGMLYNDVTMPPYALPANMTQSGIKTNSSKGGGGFNELMMEDKKGAELVRFKSERNYEQIVLNDATLSVHRNLTETVKTGDHTFKVEKGNQSVTVEMGNHSLTTKLGSITMEAMKSITLKVGQNSIVLDQKGITIKGILVKIEGTAMFEAKAPLTQVKGDAMVIIKGGITLIN